MPAWVDPVSGFIVTTLLGVAVFLLKSILKEIGVCATGIAVAMTKLEDHGARIERLEDAAFVPERGRY